MSKLPESTDRDASAVGEGSIVLAGGGTGGHISPGIAIAEEIAQLAPEYRCVFACSTRAVDARMLEHVGADFVPIAAEGLSLKPARLYRFARAFLQGRAQSRALLAERGARAVVALGGYVTGPMASAARAMKVPILLVNLDATPGKANRMVARGAARILTALPTPTMPTSSLGASPTPTLRASWRRAWPARARPFCWPRPAAARAAATALGLLLPPLCATARAAHRSAPCRGLSSVLFGRWLPWPQVPPSAPCLRRRKDRADAKGCDRLEIASVLRVGK